MPARPGLAGRAIGRSRRQVTSWKLTAYAPKPVIHAALLAHDEVWDWDPDLVISGSEVAEDRPDDWVLEAWYPGKPGKTQKRRRQPVCRQGSENPYRSSPMPIGSY